MKKILCLFLTVFTLQAFSQDVTITDANARKRTLNAAFNAIEVSDGIELYLSQGSEESIAVSVSNDKYLDRFITVVEDGTLKIYYDKKAMVWNNNERRKLKAYVSFKNLQRLKGSSGAQVSVKNVLAVSSLQMAFSSGSQFNGTVAVSNLEATQNSGSEIILSGTADHFKSNLSSGALLKGYDLTVNYCEAKASSGAEVRITVNKEMAARANSGGSIRYKGEGVLKDINVNSGGSVKRS